MTKFILTLCSVFALNALSHAAALPAANVERVTYAPGTTSLPNISASENKPSEGLTPKAIADLRLSSYAAVVYDEITGKPLYGKNQNVQLPIASITKLMTAMVALDANPALDEMMSISMDDIDTLRGSHSRLGIGVTLSRHEMLRLALMSSENRAASALARYYPGGLNAFVVQMNRKAAALGMTNSHFVDSTGLHSENVSTASDLVKMVQAGYQYPLIREFTTTASHRVDINGVRELGFNNSNALVKSGAWDIGLSKTGYIREAGRCLVMQAKINNKPVVIVLLDSAGKDTRVGDANRIKQWLDPNFIATRLVAVKHRITKRYAAGKQRHKVRIAKKRTSRQHLAKA